MKLPRTVVNRLLASAHAAGGRASGVVTRDAQGSWRVESEDAAALEDRTVVARWRVGPVGAVPRAAIDVPLLTISADTKGVLKLSATRDGVPVEIEITG